MSAVYALASTILRASGVHVSIGGAPVLSGVDLSLADVVRPGCVTGQVAAILGPSGIGKTRLLRVLAGLDAPDRGSVLVGEAQTPVRAGMVGLVAQSCPLFEDRTVLSNLIVAARAAGLARRDASERAAALLSRFGLTARGDAYPAELSGGQRQRIAIAQQFLASDHFLLMDEPFSGLDPIASDDVCGLIREIASIHELNTVILSTHAIDLALEVSDTVWLLGKGPSGARIVATYDLMERGLAWNPDARRSPELLALGREIHDRFRTL